MTGSEIESKLASLGQFLERHRYEAALLSHPANFAWITAGRDNAAADPAEHIPAAILATRSQRICLASSAEAQRMEAEELAGTGIPVVSYPWHDRAAAQKAVGEVLGSRRVACDADLLGLGLPLLPPTATELRWSLGEGELARYREGGRRMTAAVQEACLQIKSQMSEHEIAAALSFALHRQGLSPRTCLVAGEERLERCRHAPPTERKVQRLAVIAVSARYRGLICAMSRVICFGRPSDELHKRQQAACNLETTLIVSSRPGRRMSELFALLEKAYSENGAAEQWRLLEQGGSAGYQRCELTATPEGTATVREGQAFAWHPSVGGLRSEDTFVVTPRGPEMITQISGDWPKLIGYGAGQSLPRPDMLVL